MHITQKEIADRLGVSRQLVTHALNGVGTISEQKRREVLEAAEAMGYRRNELARAMVTGKSSTLGVLSHETDQSDHLMRALSEAQSTTANENATSSAMTIRAAGRYSRVGALHRVAYRIGGASW
jgi:DNA-binding LacI/PurR family transcriptional regulator